MVEPYEGAFSRPGTPLDGSLMLYKSRSGLGSGSRVDLLDTLRFIPRHGTIKRLGIPSKRSRLESRAKSPLDFECAGDDTDSTRSSEEVHRLVVNVGDGEKVDQSKALADMMSVEAKQTFLRLFNKS